MLLLVRHCGGFVVDDGVIGVFCECAVSYCFDDDDVEIYGSKERTVEL